MLPALPEAIGELPVDRGRPRDPRLRCEVHPANGGCPPLGLPKDPETTGQLFGAFYEKWAKRAKGPKVDSLWATVGGRPRWQGYPVPMLVKMGEQSC